MKPDIWKLKVTEKAKHNTRNWRQTTVRPLILVLSLITVKNRPTFDQVVLFFRTAPAVKMSDKNKNAKKKNSNFFVKNLNRRQQTSRHILFFFAGHASGVLRGVECLSRMCCASREWQYWLRQTGRNRDKGRNWDTVGCSVMHEQQHTCQSKLNMRTHTCTLTTIKWHTQVSDSDVAHVHIFTSHEVEPVSWCRAVLNFKGHLRHVKPVLRYGHGLTHTCTWMNSRLYSLALMSELIPVFFNLPVRLWRFMEISLKNGATTIWKETSSTVWKAFFFPPGYLTCCQLGPNKNTFEAVSSTKFWQPWQ